MNSQIFSAGMDPERLAEMVEERHLHAFREFYESLPDQRDIFYMFFTSGLLHWVFHSERFVPAGVNLVLIGSALDPAEVDWVHHHLDRPFHHVEMDVDDKTIWEFLFRTNRHNFGWLDIDCFVFNPDLFREMVQIGPDALANCTFSFQSSNGVDVLLTYFLFMNVDVIRSVSARTPISPCVYTFERSRAARKPAYAYAKVLTPDLIDLLAEALPRKDDGRPAFLSEANYYDTLQVYQVVAQVLGYRLHKVRALGWNAASDEVVHIGKASYYRTRWSDPDSPAKRQSYALLLQTEYLLLASIHEPIPERYVLYREELTRELEELEIPADLGRLQENLSQVMAGVGLGRHALARIVDPREPALTKFSLTQIADDLGRQK